MPTNRAKLAPLALTLFMFAATAQAETRSSNALPQSSAHGQGQAKSSPQGPKDGFPDNHGLERAREVANEHARFQRHDSDG